MNSFGAIWEIGIKVALIALFIFLIVLIAALISDVVDCVPGISALKAIIGWGWC